VRLGPLVGTEVVTEAFEAGLDGTIGGPQGAGTGRGEAQLDPPAVRGTAPPLHQAAGFEPVDQRGHARPADLEASGQRGRGGGVHLGEVAEEPVLGQGQLDVGRSLLDVLGQPGEDPPDGRDLLRPRSFDPHTISLSNDSRCAKADGYAARPPPSAVPEYPIDVALGLLAVSLLIAANGVFVAAEFALVAVDRSGIDRRAEAGDRRARLVRSLLRRLSFHLSGAQLGITVTSLVIGFIARPTVAELMHPPLGAGVALLVALLAVTAVQMVVGELIPKGVAIAHPDTTSRGLAPFLRWYGALFGPVIRVLNGAANWTVRRLGLEPAEELSQVRSLPELELVIAASAEEGTLAGSASTLLTRSIRFGRKTAADALIPRVSVHAVSCEATAAELVSLAASTGHSRFPVYGADLDDIRGVVLVKRVHRVPPEQRDQVTVAELMDDVLAVPETRELEDLLFDMQERRQHLVVVVDEYGGTAGIVTLEDLVEEIVGEIDDEYDTRTPLLTAPGPAGTWVLPGTLHPDEVTDICGFELPEGPYETLAGFVLDRLGRIPEVGDGFTHGEWTIEVARMDRRRIAEVVLRASEPGAAPT